MQCKNCLAENDATAAFCSRCGARLDGKKQCKTCGEWNQGDAVFCVKCGTRLDGKKQCKTCGAVLADRDEFCPQCGAAQTKRKTRKARVRSTRQPTAGDWSPTQKANALRYTKCGLGMALLFFSLLFTFLTGFENVTALNNESGASWLIYEFFGNVYKEIRIVLHAVTGYTQFFAQTLYVPMIFGTILAAGLLVAVVAFAAIGIARYVLYLCGKSEKTGTGSAYAAFAAYLAGVVGILSVLNSSQEDSVVHVNGCVIAGLVLGSIAAAGLFAVTCIEKRAVLFAPKALPHTILTFAALAVTVTQLILIAIPVLGIEVAGESYMRAGYLILLGTIGMLNATRVRENVTAQVFSGIGILAFMVWICVIVCSVWILCRFLRQFETDSRDDTAPVVCGMTAAAVALVLSVLYGAVFCDIFPASLGADASTVDVHIGYGIPIALAVLSGANLAAVCLQKLVFPVSNESKPTVNDTWVEQDEQKDISQENIG